MEERLKIYKKELDDLLERNILTKDEYNEFFKSMNIIENGEMIGVIPNGRAYQKYQFDGDLLGDDLLDFVIKNVIPPYGAETIDNTFRTYGMMLFGIGDTWKWFRKGEMSEHAIKSGHKPIEDDTESELWKMIAISSRYLEVFYQRIEQRNNSIVSFENYKEK